VLCEANIPSKTQNLHHVPKKQNPHPEQGVSSPCEANIPIKTQNPHHVPKKQNPHPEQGVSSPELIHKLLTLGAAVIPCSDT